MTNEQEMQTYVRAAKSLIGEIADSPDLSDAESERMSVELLALAVEHGFIQYPVPGGQPFVTLRGTDFIMCLMAATPPMLRPAYKSSVDMVEAAAADGQL